MVDINLFFLNLTKHSISTGSATSQARKMIKRTTGIVMFSPRITNYHQNVKANYAFHRNKRRLWLIGGKID